MQQREFGRAEGCVRSPAALQAVINVAHEVGRGSIVYIPERAYHVVRPGTEKCPRKPYQSLAGISRGACPVA